MHDNTIHSSLIWSETLNLWAILDQRNNGLSYTLVTLILVLCRVGRYCDILCDILGKVSKISKISWLFKLVRSRCIIQCKIDLISGVMCSET